MDKTSRSILVVIALSIIMALVVVAVVSNVPANSESVQPFYVGVNFCGDSSVDAKLLIDKARNYTNLFVLQSGPLMYDLDATVEICDYAVNSGLSVLICYTYNSDIKVREDILNIAQTRWGEQFLGIYYNDEPGGKMLDGQPLRLCDNVFKNQDGSLQFSTSDNATMSSITYSISGVIRISTEPIPPPGIYWRRVNNSVVNNTDEGVISTEDITPTRSTTEYFPNGTIHYTIDQRTLTYHPNGSVQDGNGQSVSDQGNISTFLSYQEVLKTLPIQTYSDAAQYYIKAQQDSINEISNLSSCRLFTSDYALYWWDYQCGYDAVFAELGWNNTVAQEIDLVRGAASLQGKSWGTIITWKYMQAPYLPNGNEMFEQMKASYEAGAEYVVVFNYAEDMSGPYGTLQEEHFQALERFWKEVVQNPNVVNGDIKAETALVLPADYGWGLRNQNDTIWGLWKADGTSQQVWNQVQNKVSEYGLKLDIVYDDAAYPVLENYSKVFYWNQTG